MWEKISREGRQVCGDAVHDELACGLPALATSSSYSMQPSVLSNLGRVALADEYSSKLGLGFAGSLAFCFGA